MPPYELHCHVWKAVGKDAPNHVPTNEQLKPLYTRRAMAATVAEQLIQSCPAGRFYFSEVCYTDPRICLLKIDGLDNLSLLPAVYHETRQGIIYKPPDFRFQWVQPGHPYALPAEFCGHRRQTPDLARRCREQTERRYRRLWIQIAAADLVVIYPDRFRDYWIPPP